MTRLFRNGRTETVRSLSREANEFVKGFLDPARSQEEKRDLLKVACEQHATLYKDAMNGLGIDRHLFALYVASRGMGIVSATHDSLWFDLIRSIWFHYKDLI